MPAQIRGVSQNSDLDPNLISRDTRSWRHKLQDFAADSNAGIVLIAFGILTIILPFAGITFLNDPIFIGAIVFWLYSRNKVRSFQFRRKMVVDKNGTPLLDSKGKLLGNGIFCLGNEMVTASEIWFSNDDLRTHMLVFGSTGSGKTRFLLGMLYQALLVGSGCMYVDGKGDNTVWWLVFSFCRRVDRLEDLLVINYLTGGDTKRNKKDKKRFSLSNTNNPFAHGSGEQLRSLVVGLMRESGGDGDMWKGMASAMMGGLLKCLTHMRDSGEINLDVATLRDNLPLDAIVRLSFRPDLPDSALAPIKKYLAELPGFVEEEALVSRINSKVYEQHGYRIMQFSEVLSDLEDTYGHIFSAPLGEVDFKDVVFNRRILFVMLPALEKDPDALSGLGKMVVAGVRSALAPALGNSLEGLKSEVIDQKPTTSNVPFLMILDEYGYYSVKGFAVVAAQARSLGVSVIFAGQDYPSFKKGSETEAQATVANTNIKIGMKVEEKETADIIIGRGGKGKVNVVEGSESTFNGLTSGFKDSDRVRIEERDRIDFRDLVNQTNGEAHIMFADKISRANLFFADPKLAYEAYLNKFIMVEHAKKSKIDEINGVFSKFTKLFDESKRTDSKDSIDSKSSSALDDGLKNIFEDFRLCKKHDEDSFESSIFAISMSEIRASIKDVEFEKKVDEVVAPDKSASKVIDLDLDDIVSLVEPSEQSKVPEKNDPTWKEMVDLSKSPVEVDEPQDILASVEDGNAPRESISEEATFHSNEFENLLNEVVVSEIEKIKPLMSAQDKISAKPRNTLAELAMISGASEGDAKRDSSRAIEILGEKVRYPKKPTPAKAEKIELKTMFDLLVENLDKEMV